MKEGNRTHEFCQQPGTLLQLLGSLTCPKVGTWDRLFNFPSEGRHAEDFYTRKIQRVRPGLNPRTREPEASMLTTRPPKPSLSTYTYAVMHTTLKRLHTQLIAVYPICIYMFFFYDYTVVQSSRRRLKVK
jgi:hypothetical protein